ncbi:MAG: polysaccharide biosynthesis C-terminal domain-containing protein, partial [Deltaproteobacteria bacterium]|nr:polysaccharide biosynthesis C-terminal domain-containing protein [Deltaproteobacteria bacterium]
FFPRFNFNVHPELKSLLGLMLPAAYGAAVYQLNVIVIRFFASYLETGAVSYLWYANRLFEFPMGVFAIALATAIQPTLSDHAAENSWEKFKGTLNYGLRQNFLITIPAMAGLIVLAHPLVRVLLQRGAFDPAAAEATAQAMIAFAVGLPFLGFVRLIVPAFYALKDSKAPVAAATIAVLVNVVLSWWWVQVWGHIGLALAVSASSFVNACALFLAMRKKIGRFGGRSVVRVFFQSSLAAAVMGLVLWWPQAKGWWLNAQDSFWLQGGQLLLAVAAGILGFFMAARLIGCREVREIVRTMRRKEPLR